MIEKFADFLKLNEAKKWEPAEYKRSINTHVDSDISHIVVKDIPDGLYKEDRDWVVTVDSPKNRLGVIKHHSNVFRFDGKGRATDKRNSVTIYLEDRWYYHVYMSDEDVKMYLRPINDLDRTTKKFGL